MGSYTLPFKVRSHPPHRCGGIFACPRGLGWSDRSRSGDWICWRSQFGSGSSTPPDKGRPPPAIGIVTRFGSGYSPDESGHFSRPSNFAVHPPGRVTSTSREEAKMQIRFRGRAVSVAGLAASFLLASGPRLWAQQVPHVLIVGPLDNYGALLAGVLEGLHSAGFTQASQIRVDTRSASSPDEAKAAIGAALDTGIDAIVTVFGPSTQAASAATTKIPIIFCPVADPVASKLAVSNDAPGGNLTGVATADAEASRLGRIAAFRQVLPTLKRLAVLFDSGFAPDRVQMKNFEEIASSSGIVLVLRPLSMRAPRSPRFRRSGAATPTQSSSSRIRCSAVLGKSSEALRWDKSFRSWSAIRTSSSFRAWWPRSAPTTGQGEDLRPHNGQNPQGRQASRSRDQASVLRSARQSAIRATPRRRRPGKCASACCPRSFADRKAQQPSGRGSGLRGSRTAQTQPPRKGDRGPYPVVGLPLTGRPMEPLLVGNCSA